jgi:hypothetical protein
MGEKERAAWAKIVIVIRVRVHAGVELNDFMMLS